MTGRQPTSQQRGQRYHHGTETQESAYDARLAKQLQFNGVGMLGVNNLLRLVLVESKHEVVGPHTGQWRGSERVPGHTPDVNAAAGGDDGES
jgi:hypothetical protein